jgi:RNA polymerase primary sigma factor
VSLDLTDDDVSLAGADAEDPAEQLNLVEQSGNSVWDEEESGALRDARKDAEITLSVDSVRAYLKQIGKITLLNAEQEVDLAKRIEAGLYAAERLHRSEDATGKLSPQLRRDLRWIVRDGERAKNHLLEANLPGRLAGQALHRQRYAISGPDPGGQRGSDPRGGEVRLHQGI